MLRDMPRPKRFPNRVVFHLSDSLLARLQNLTTKTQGAHDLLRIATEQYVDREEIGTTTRKIRTS